MTTSTDIVNEALNMIAARQQISALNDGSVPANAATVLYAPTVSLLLRDMDPDFARFTAALSLSGASSPVPPWAYEYLYPADCVRLRAVRPAAGSYNKNDPQPVPWNVGFDVISAVNTKVILTNQQNALAVYTSSTPTESQWDSLFRDAVVRRLANPLAMALAGRPDFAREILDEAERIKTGAELRDEALITMAA